MVRPHAERSADSTESVCISCRGCVQHVTRCVQHVTRCAYVTRCHGGCVRHEVCVMGCVYVTRCVCTSRGLSVDGETPRGEERREHRERLHQMEGVCPARHEVCPTCHGTCPTRPGRWHVPQNAPISPMALLNVILFHPGPDFSFRWTTRTRKPHAERSTESTESVCISCTGVPRS